MISYLVSISPRHWILGEEVQQLDPTRRDRHHHRGGRRDGRAAGRRFAAAAVQHRALAQDRLGTHLVQDLPCKKAIHR